MFKKNLGTLDRTLRVTLGVALITYGIFSMGTMGYILAVIGALPLVTGLVGNCPVYSIFKFNTFKTPHFAKSCTWDEGMKS